VGGGDAGEEDVPELFLLREVADIVEEVFCRSPRPHAANMHIQKLKVRPKKSVHRLLFQLFCAFSNCFADATVSLCAPELATMLGCWAAKNDMTTTGTCAESAKALYDCMRTTVRIVNHPRFRV